MKKIFLYFFALAATVACNRVEVDDNLSLDGKELASGMITEIISGSQGSSTKASINADASFSWTTGDNVAVHVSNGTTGTGKYVFTSDQGAEGAVVDSEHPNQARFKVVYEAGYSRDGFAIFPSTIVSTDAAAASYGQDADHPLVVTLPSSYTLAQVSGTTSPCPMISTNEATSTFNGWNFYQLCSLLRLTVSDIPTTARRLEIDFNGKKVCGEFSITFPVRPESSVIATSDDYDDDVITITKNGQNVTLDETSLDLNIPLPTGNYKKITVIAYDALTGGKALKGWTVAFNYTAQNTYATKKEATQCSLQSTFNFTFKNGNTELSNVRFARVFSVKNALHNTLDHGPYTKSANENLTSPINATLYFDKASNDQLVFQVVTGDGKVYSGSVDAPSDGYDIGETYNITANVNLYTFTVSHASASTAKKVCFSPGDLGIENGVYSFSEPFERWGGTGAQDASKRVYFEGSEVYPDKTIYGITWRLQTWPKPTNNKNEWENIIARTMNVGVRPYYKVQVGSNKYCVLLPPDETLATDIGEDLTTQVTDYVKYIAKGFVILINTSYKSTTWQTSDRAKYGGYYWVNKAEGPQDRCYFYWTDTANPTTVKSSSGIHCLHARYVHDIVVE